MKKHGKYGMELIMACLLLVGFYLLSRQAAVVSVQMATEQGEERNDNKKKEKLEDRKV